jgi:hypothetical protein
MTFSIDEISRIKNIFFPYANQRFEKIKQGGSRFVHYTSAEAAASIIKSKEMWMRNSTTMSDFMEVEHGFECMNEAYKSESGKNFKKALEAIFPGAAKEIEDRFNGWLPGIRRGTYLTCISEHKDNEDAHGRLSMWRAYGRSLGVALVLNPEVFASESNALNVFSSPVEYLGRQGYFSFFADLAKAMEADAALINKLGKDQVVSLMFQVFRFGVVCTKHPGFSEELEWRLIHSPEIEPTNVLKHDIETINGVPQEVIKIPLHDIPEKGLIGASIPKLLNRVIIGPTQFPQAMFQAFVKLLTESGVSEPQNKIFISDIPIR